MRCSRVAKDLYAQWVVGKYDGILGWLAPSRSRRRKRDICDNGVRKVDIPEFGFDVPSQDSARDLFQ